MNPLMSKCRQMGKINPRKWQQVHLLATTSCSGLLYNVDTKYADIKTSGLIWYKEEISLDNLLPPPRWPPSCCYSVHSFATFILAFTALPSLLFNQNKGSFQWIDHWQYDVTLSSSPFHIEVANDKTTKYMASHPFLTKLLLYKKSCRIH